MFAAAKLHNTLIHKSDKNFKKIKRSARKILIDKVKTDISGVKLKNYETEIKKFTKELCELQESNVDLLETKVNSFMEIIWRIRHEELFAECLEKAKLGLEKQIAENLNVCNKLRAEYKQLHDKLKNNEKLCKSIKNEPVTSENVLLNKENLDKLKAENNQLHVKLNIIKNKLYKISSDDTNIDADFNLKSIVTDTDFHRTFINIHPKTYYVFIVNDVQPYVQITIEQCNHVIHGFIQHYLENCLENWHEIDFTEFKILLLRDNLDETYVTNILQKLRDHITKRDNVNVRATLHKINDLCSKKYELTYRNCYFYYNNNTTVVLNKPVVTNKCKTIHLSLETNVMYTKAVTVNLKNETIIFN